MRQRKSIDVFNISFLDLLSGALGAVIILFIVVPKNEAPNIEEPEQKEVCVDNSQALSSCQSLAKDQKKVINELTNQLKDATKLAAAKIEKKEVKQEVTQSSSNDVGFNFKGKRIAFLIDVSGSMATDDRIGEVKAGLKMLIASMGKDYYVDIIYFPHLKESHYSLWGVLQDLRDLTIKEEIYGFLARLKPQGTTPTRDALMHTLDNYPNLTDIVLLSDGEPTTSARSSSPDNIKDILEDVKRKNTTRNVQINAIGVGAKNFSKSSNLYKFLKKLTDTNNGFFYGF